MDQEPPGEAPASVDQYEDHTADAARDPSCRLEESESLGWQDRWTSKNSQSDVLAKNDI